VYQDASYLKFQSQKLRDLIHPRLASFLDSIPPYPELAKKASMIEISGEVLMKSLQPWTRHPLIASIFTLIRPRAKVLA
jgi:hypothetical protein